MQIILRLILNLSTIIFIFLSLIHSGNPAIKTATGNYILDKLYKYENIFLRIVFGQICRVLSGKG
jgi:hypothetical protein